MNFKTTYVLFGLLGGLLVVLGVVLWRDPSSPASDRYVLRSMHDKANKMDPGDVDRVEIEILKPKSETIVFERDPSNEKDKDWKITSPRTLRADSANVQSLVNQLHDAEMEKERNPKNFQDAGLDAPARVITLKKGNRAVTLTIGNVTPGEESAVVYVKSSDRPKDPLAVRKQRLAAALEGLNYFRARDLVGDNTSDIQGVTLTETKGSRVKTVVLEKGTEAWHVVKPIKAEAEFDPLLKHVPNLKVAYTDEKNNDFVADGVTDLAKFKGGALDESKHAVLRIRVKREGGKKSTVVVGVSKKVEGKEDKKEAKYYAYLDAGDSPKDIVLVPAAEVDPFVALVRDPGSLRSKDLVQLKREPDAIIIEHHDEGSKIELLRADASRPWELYTNGKGQPAHEPEVQQLISVLNKKKQVEFRDAPKKSAKPYLTVKLYTDSFKKGAKKGAKPVFKNGAKPAVILNFRRRPSGSATGTVERDWSGDKAWVKVGKEVYEQVDKPALAFYDRALPKFASDDRTDDVTKLVLERDGITYEVTRAKSDAPWKFVQPAAQKGRDASADTVQTILNVLNAQRANEVKALKADESERKSYGLKPPVVRAAVTVTKDGKNTTTSYLYGKDPGDKKGIYAKVGGRDPIYLVDRAILTTLGQELRNTRVFTFEPRDVAEIKLTGWYDTAEETTKTRTLERKGEGWAFKGLKAAVNNAEVSSFLETLSRLQAKKFVDKGKGFAPASGGFTIEITFKDKEQKKLQLTLGAEQTDKATKDETYFARSPAVGTDRFLVDKAPFAGLRASSSFFVAKK